MPTYSDEKIKLLRTQILKIMIRKPHIGCYKIAEALKIDPHFANKLMNKIYKEREHRMDRQIVNVELSKMQDHYIDIVEEAWGIISNKERERFEYFGKNSSIGKDGKPLPIKIEYGDYLVSPRDKMMASQRIMEAFEKMFKMKFDAGVFERKLGELDVNLPIGEMVAEISKITGNEFKWQKNKGLKKYKANVNQKETIKTKSKSSRQKTSNDTDKRQE